MGRRALSLVICIILSCAGNTFAADRDVSARDLKGVPKSHRYFWAVLGGTAAGAGLGIIAPGGTKSAFKELCSVAASPQLFIWPRTRVQLTDQEGGPM